MSVVREMADALQLLKEVVSNTRDLVDATKQGRQVLRSKFPEAEPQFEELLTQMRKTVAGLAEVTSIVSRFKFTVEGTAVDSEAVRFNDYVIGQAGKLADLRSHMADLKGSSGRIRDLRDDLNRLAAKSDWWSPMFMLLGVSRREEAERLAGQLSNFYADDERMLGAIESMLHVAETAIEEVNEALGGRGAAYPHLVPVAAGVLRIYADTFAQSQTELDRLAASMTEVITSLRKGSSSGSVVPP